MSKNENKKTRNKQTSKQANKQNVYSICSSTCQLVNLSTNN